MPKAATIELATLPRERQQRGVDQQLLEEIRARVGRIGDPVALCGLDALSLTARDIANLRPQVEDRLAERRVHLGAASSAATCAAVATGSASSARPTVTWPPFSGITITLKVPYATIKYRRPPQSSSP